MEWGLEKIVAALDAKEAAAQGLYQRPLTTSVVEKHLADLGLEPEFGTHSHIRGLSGACLEDSLPPRQINFGEGGSCARGPQPCRCPDRWLLLL